MQLDGDKLILKINLLHAGLQHQLAELLLLVQAGMTVEVGEIYFAGLHSHASIII